MADNLEINADSIYSIANSLSVSIGEYKKNISSLISLVNEINSSSAWKDVQVKTSFIATCNSYISKYKELSIQMEKYRNYLTSKTDSSLELEQAFTKGGAL